MSSSLVPIGNQRPNRLATGRALSEISLATQLAVANESGLAEVFDTRILNATLIVERATVRLAVVDHLIGQVSHERPHLEIALRTIQEDLAIGVGSKIREFIQR